MERNLRKEVRKNKRLKDFLLKSKQPGYEIIRHPRFFNKPASCLAGLHKGLINKFINGVLHLYCTKCGEAIGQGIKDKTWTREEMHKIKVLQRGRGRPRTKT